MGGDDALGDQVVGEQFLVDAHGLGDLHAVFSVWQTRLYGRDYRVRLPGNVLVYICVVEELLGDTAELVLCGLR